MSAKRFNLVTPGTNEVVMGPLTLLNAYLTAYANLKGQKRPAELAIGEHIEAEYRLSGEKGTYWIVRIEDDAP